MLAVWLEWVWEWIKALAESTFALSAIGSLAGAWGGAYAIQRIAEKAKKRDGLLQELRTCCHAIEMAHNVGNTYIELKRQHVKALKELYDTQRAEVHALHAANAAGALPPGLQVHIAFESDLMNPVRTRAAYLESLVLEKMSAPVRPRSISVMLTRATEQLNETIELRNQVLSRLSQMSHQERFARMFGLPVPAGVDNLYRDYVDGIHQYTDDSIHFARMVGEDLYEYGKRVRKEYQDALPRRQRRDVMMVPVVYWTDEENAHLLPSKEKYTSWYTGFVYRIPRTKGRRFAKAWLWLRKAARKVLGQRKRP